MKDYKQEVKGHKDKLMQNHRVRKRLDSMQEVAAKLVSPSPPACQAVCTRSHYCPVCTSSHEAHASARDACGIAVWQWALALSSCLPLLAETSRTCC